MKISVECIVEHYKFVFFKATDCNEMSTKQQRRFESCTGLTSNFRMNIADILVRNTDAGKTLNAFKFLK